MRYESLIFDIDGTLWDSRALVAEGYNIQLEKEGLSHLAVNAELFRPLFGKVMTEIADIIFPSIPAPERYALMERCMDTENKYLKANPCRIGYPAVRETMETLSKTHRLFIVSNSQKGYPELCIEKLGLAPFIRGHLCFGDTGTSKGKTIRALMRKYDITDCAYIGDTQGDYEATLEAGVPFIWAAYGFGTPDRFDYKIDSFAELLNLPE
ncbi:MAG: HAD family hydrolase [Candidatus Faecousia sp.]|nr:HAD family hydrolase [Clostridiales bacterium]MDD5884083.1 HAD family hydrolase [Bacillota bacterium]MDY4599733.1 HAD family hydrolase [Candidatus Faecousia sp.]